MNHPLSNTGAFKRLCPHRYIINSHSDKAVSRVSPTGFSENRSVMLEEPTGLVRAKLVTEVGQSTAREAGIGFGEVSRYLRLDGL